MATYVFIGPSVPGELLAELPPDVTVLPPVAAGDLLRLRPREGDVVGIVDGFFLQAAAVRHKEIMFLLQNGVAVWGAASIGALRAAELEPFGMHGCGEIFRAYSEGEIDGDDEVAVVHASEDDGHAPLSEALVNIRHNLRRATGRGICDRDTAAECLRLAKSMPFMDRTYDHVFSRALESGADPEQVEPLRQFVRDDHDDLKTRDALLLLDEIRGWQPDPTPKAAAGSNWLNDTIYLHRWIEEAAGSEDPAAGFIPGVEALQFCQLLATDYPEFHYLTALRTIVDTNSAQDDGGEAGPSVELVRSTPEEHLRLRQAVIAYAVREGILGNRAEIDANPEMLADWLTEDEVDLPAAERFARFAVRSFCISPRLVWRSPIMGELKRIGKLDEAFRAVAEARIFNRALKEAHPEFREDILRPERIIEWFHRRWNVSGDLDLALLDRGFANVERFVDCARPFYLFDKLDGRYRSFSIGAAEFGHVQPAQPIGSAL